MAALDEVAGELKRRLASIFLPDENGRRACHGEVRRYADDPHWRDLVLFYEYFHGDTGRGVGASHQTGWTALVTRCIENQASRPSAPAAAGGPIRAAHSHKQAPRHAASAPRAAAHG